MGLAKSVVQSFEIPFGEAKWAHDWRWMPDVRNACHHPKVLTGRDTWRSSIVTIKKESPCTHVVMSGGLKWNMTLKIWSSHVELSSWRNKPLPLLPCTLCPGQLDPSSEFMWILLGHSLEGCTSYSHGCALQMALTHYKPLLTIVDKLRNPFMTIINFSRQNDGSCANGCFNVTPDHSLGEKTKLKHCARLQSFSSCKNTIAKEAGSWLEASLGLLGFLRLFRIITNL